MVPISGDNTISIILRSGPITMTDGGTNLDSLHHHHLHTNLDSLLDHHHLQQPIHGGAHLGPVLLALLLALLHHVGDHDDHPDSLLPDQPPEVGDCVSQGPLPTLHCQCGLTYVRVEKYKSKYANYFVSLTDFSRKLYLH